jgi:hypothetical protein
VPAIPGSAGQYKIETKPLGSANKLSETSKKVMQDKGRGIEGGQIERWQLEMSP